MIVLYMWAEYCRHEGIKHKSSPGRIGGHPLQRRGWSLSLLFYGCEPRFSSQNLEFAEHANIIHLFPRCSPAMSRTSDKLSLDTLTRHSAVRPENLNEEQAPGGELGMGQTCRLRLQSPGLFWVPNWSHVRSTEVFSFGHTVTPNHKNPAID